MSELVRTELVVGSEELEEHFKFFGFDQCTNAQFSYLFLAQLVTFTKLRILNTFAISREVLALEGVRGTSLTKPAERYTSGKISGFWHKHFSDARHLGINVTQHLAKGDVTKGEAEYPTLKRIVNRVMDPSKSSTVTQGMINELAHTLSVKAYEQRAKAKKLTGDWIVFAKHNGQNHYLAIASHSQNTDQLYELIKEHCAGQFPFLFA